ncbi:hypothetical protein D6833_00680, partial [Candidatus Parcubacteria bacterium]
MPRKPRAVYLYAVLLLLLSAAITAAHVLRGELRPPTLSAAVLMAVFVALTAAAGAFALPISPRTKVVVDTSLIFAAGLLFPPPWAGAIAALGIGIRLMLVRPQFLDLLINISVGFLETTALQFVFSFLGGTFPAHFTEAFVALPLLGAGLAFLALDRLLIYTAVALYQGLKLRQIIFSNWAR